MRLPWLPLLLALLTSAALARPLVVAHRGGTTLGAENAIATFQKACELGVDAVELDIHQTSDGGLVVIHDETLVRTFGRAGQVGAMTEAELATVGLPTLDQAIDATAGRCRLFVEIKHPHGGRYQGIESRLLKILRSHDILSSAVVISFDETSLRKLHELEPALATGLLVGGSGNPAKAKAELGISYYSPHYSKVDAALLKTVRDAGLKLSVWTVDDEAAMKAMDRAGCDAITTNRPAELLKAVGR